MIPYPPTARSGPIRALANDLTRFSQGLQQSALQWLGVAQRASSGWQGSAAQAFGAHTQARSTTLTQTGQTIATAAAPLQAFAAAIDATRLQHAAGVKLELAGIAACSTGWGSAAGKAMIKTGIAQQKAAIAAHQLAGTACASALAAIVAKVAAAQFAGVGRGQAGTGTQQAAAIWSAVAPMIADGDTAAAAHYIDQATGTFTTSTDPLSYGDGRRVATALSPQLRRGDTALDAFAGVLAGVGILSQPQLRVSERPDLLEQLDRGGYTFGAPDSVQLGRNMGLLEDFRRPSGREEDQAAVVVYREGRTPDGRRIIDVTIPGIVPPGPGSTFGESGARNLPNAGYSQISGRGVEEAALRRWLAQQNLAAGDVVSLNGHSQGGIVARNVANDLGNDGFDVRLTTYSSPTGPTRPGVRAFAVESRADAVPTLSVIGGDGDGDPRQHRGQHRILINLPAFEHGAEAYGRHLAENGRRPEIAALHRHLAEHRDVSWQRRGVLTLEGPRNPQGDPVRVGEPYRLVR